MKIYAMHSDKSGLTLADKNTAHAVKTYDAESMTIRVMLSSMMVEISVAELANLLTFAEKSELNTPNQ